jgi:hypothetical protein
VGEDWPTILREDADRAIRLNNWLTRRMLWAADKHVSGSEFGRMVNSMRSLFSERPGEPWSLTTIARRTRNLTPRQREDVLKTLILRGEVSCEQVETSGRPATVYFGTEIPEGE